MKEYLKEYLREVGEEEERERKEEEEEKEEKERDAERDASRGHKRKAPSRPRTRPAKKPPPNPRPSKTWAETVSELRRLAAAERQFLSTNSSSHLLKKVLSSLRRAQSICRGLDRAAGCPETYINPLWGTLAEGDALRNAPVPSGWSVRTTPAGPVFRETATGRTQDGHPDEEVERVREACRVAASGTVFGEGEPREMLGEIVGYMKVTYGYGDMDEDLEELDEEIEGAGRREEGTTTTPRKGREERRQSNGGGTCLGQ